MERKKLYTDIYPVIHWALLTLGASELLLLLSGPFYALLVTFVCACIFSISLVYLYHKGANLRQICFSVLLCAGILIITKWLFGYFVLLDVSAEVFAFESAGIATFLFGALATGIVLIKVVHGTG